MPGKTTAQFCTVFPLALGLAVWRVLAVNATFGPSGTGKALCVALWRSVWTRAGGVGAGDILAGH